MSSSPSRARIAQPGARPAAVESRTASPFLYSDVTVPLPPGHPGFRRTDSAAAGKDEFSGQAMLLAQSREAGRQQGEREARAKFDQEVIVEHAAIAQAVAEFARERHAYYLKIEQEAVQLALSIARKVLHREAQVDPLLLMGTIRVALEQMEGATSVVLAVHPETAAAWRTNLGREMGAARKLEIIEDPALALDQVELRTSMGIAVLGLEVQLKEIEQGLMDLLAARPRDREPGPT